MRRPAFSLIEIVVALAIASFMAVLLFRMLNQTSRTLRVGQGLTTTTMNITGFYDRFERDVCGAFIPEMGDPERVARALQKAEQKKQAAEHQKQVAALKAGKQGPKSGAQAKSEEQRNADLEIKLKDVQVKKVFFYESSGDRLKTFSFITCNPLRVFRQYKPSIARVTYTLVEGKQNMFILKRTESEKLGFDEEKKARPYTVLNNIKGLKLEFLAPEREKQADSDDQKKSKKQQKKQQPEPPLKTYSVWPPRSEADAEASGGKKEKIKDLPRAVKVYLDYRDVLEDVTRHYEFLIPVYNYQSPGELLQVSVMHELQDLSQTGT